MYFLKFFTYTRASSTRLNISIREKPKKLQNSNEVKNGCTRSRIRIDISNFTKSHSGIRAYKPETVHRNRDKKSWVKASQNCCVQFSEKDATCIGKIDPAGSSNQV